MDDVHPHSASRTDTDYSTALGYLQIGTGSLTLLMSFMALCQWALGHGEMLNLGEVFGLNRKATGPTGIRLAVVNESTNPATQKLVDVLKAEKSFHVITTFTNPDQTTRPLTQADLRPLIQNRAFRFALLIPKSDKPGGLGLKLKSLSDPQSEIETQTVNGLLQKTIFFPFGENIGNASKPLSRLIFCKLLPSSLIV